MRRREFITLLGAGATWPLTARAQPARSPVRIGFLFFGSPSNTYDRLLVETFRQGLRQVGLTENRDIVLDLVWVGANPDQAVAEVMQRGAGILVPCGSSASVAAMRQASTIPIVFISVGNPIAMGLVESLSHPGRNATGFSDILADLGGKLVDLARELSKPPTTVDYLWHTAWPDGQNRYQATERAAQAAGIKFRSRGIADIAEVDDAIAQLKQSGATTLIIQPSPFTYQQRDRLIASAMKHGLGTIFAFPIAAREGIVTVRIGILEGDRARPRTQPVGSIECKSRVNPRSVSRSTTQSSLHRLRQLVCAPRARLAPVARHARARP